MAYIGNIPAEAYTSFDKQTITGDGGASYTLDHAVANEQEIEVFVNNVRQEPSVAYTVSGTALTMTGNVASTDDFYVVFQGKAIQTTAHPEGQDLKARDGTFSGDLTVDTDTLYVDSTNDLVGIGTSSPSTYDSRANSLVVGGSGNTGITIFSGDNQDGRIAFAEVGETGLDAGSFFYDHNDGKLRIATVGSDRMAIDGSGNVGIGTTSPDKKLTVEASSDNIFLKQTSGNHGHILDQDNADGSLSFIRRNSGTDTERMRIQAGGGVSIGQTDGNGKLNITSGSPVVRLRNNAGTSGYFTMITFRNNAGSGEVGSITRVNDASVAYNTSSDHRLKENVEDMTGAITRVKNLQPKRFNFISDTTDTLVDGFIAHEAQTVVPEAVTGTHNEVDADGNAVYQGIDQSKLVPLLTGALQEAIAKIEALETRVQALEDA